MAVHVTPHPQAAPAAPDAGATVQVSRTDAFLDTNVWVDAAKGLQDDPDTWWPLLDRLQSTVEDGRLRVPLSATHYLELWHRRDHDSRRQVATVMRDLSNYAAISPIQRIQLLEVESAVDVAPGLADTPRDLRPHVFGEGVKHAFDSPYGRFRFVDSLKTDDEPEGAPSPPPPVDPSTLEGAEWEWNSLYGPPQLVELDLDRRPEHRHGSRFADTEVARRNWLVENPSARHRLYDNFLVEEINMLLEPISQAAMQRGADPRDVFLSNPAFKTPPDAMRAFAQTMPSLHVMATLRTWKHRDTSHPWDQHDRVDLMGLCVAIPYCHVVITEKRWAHLAKASGLDRLYGTTLGAGRRPLDALAEDSGPATYRT